MAEGPRRIQLSRAHGWRMPENTVKVDRTTKWGNPFRVGVDGTVAECIEFYRLMLGGYLCLSGPPIAELKAAQQHVSRNLGRLRGRNLACWCRADRGCHADVLLELANAPEGA